MSADLDQNDTTSDEIALAFMFAIHAHGDDSTEGEFSIPQPLRHKLIDKALHQIVTQFEVELSIPWVKGRFSGIGATIIYLDKPDFSEYTKLNCPNSFGVIETHTEKSRDNGEMLLTGFDAYIRIGESNSWLCIGIRPPPDDDGFYDEADGDLGVLGLERPMLTDKNMETLCDIAAQIATDEGFSAVALRVEPRERFVEKFVQDRMDDFVEPGITQAQIIFQAAEIARSYWEFAAVPMRAKELMEAGRTTAQIAKELGITKQRAERAIDMDTESGINADAVNALVRKHLKV